MSDDKDGRIGFTIDGEAKDLAKEKLDHGELSEILRERVHQVAYGTEVSEYERLQERLRTLRQEKDGLRADRREIDAQIEDVEQQITRVEERLDKLDPRESQYEGALEMLEKLLYDGTHVFPDRPQVQQAATLGDTTADGVIADLKDRNPDVPAYAFVDGLHTSEEWTEADAERVQEQ